MQKLVCIGFVVLFSSKGFCEEQTATVRQLDAPTVIGGKRTVHQKIFSVKSDDFRAVCKRQSRDKPVAIRDKKTLATVFKKQTVQNRIAEKIDFEREQLIVFAWVGRSGERMSYHVKDRGKNSEVVFHELPRVGDGFVERCHIYLYVTGKDAKWSTGQPPKDTE